jgi:hypothetical protein
MSVDVYRFLIFRPQGDMEEYAGTKFPDSKDYPVGTWIYHRDRFTPGCGWMQLVQYTMPAQIAWEYYSLEAPELVDVTKHMKMMALVMQ